MVAHLGRDPWPARELVAPRPHLRRWIDRMASPKPGAGDSPHAGEVVPASLKPVFQAIVDEFLPLLEGINQQVWTALPALPPGKALRRGLADVELPMAMPASSAQPCRTRCGWRNAHSMSTRP
jgi:hypothetical protein